VRLELPAQNFTVVRDGAESLSAAIAAAQHPPVVIHKLPPGVRVEEVKFDGAGLKLAGTLWLPKAEAGKRAPAVLILAGSGPMPRDGVAIGKVLHYTYRDVAEHLAARGFAVLSFDKRCVGASECKRRSLLDDYVADAEAAANYRRKRGEVDPARVALFGHSEGGFLALVLASQDQKIGAVVLAATAGRTLGPLLREQIQDRFKEAGRSEAETRAYLAQLNKVIEGLMSGKTDFTQDKVDTSDPLIAGLLAAPEFATSLLVNDPLQIVHTLRMPVLILQGEKDIQVRVKDAEYLEEALKRANHHDFTMRLLPDVDHLFKTNKGPAGLASYDDASRPVDPAALAVVTEWLQKKLSQKAPSEGR
jgi:dipeptidyl aminopeptidase/acylaminoacyl peptidase